MCDLNKFESSDSIKYLKGFLIYKKEKRLSGNTIRFYVNIYMVKVDYINGKPKRIEKYIKKSDVENVRKKLADKKRNRKRYNELKRNLKSLQSRLHRLLRKEKINENIFQNIEENWREHSLFKQTDKYENAIILSALGEQLRSRGECIVANTALAFNIPYLYEPPLIISGFDDIDDLFKETVRPDFVFFINEKIVIIELLGMSDSKGYRESWERKHRHYSNSGYIQGENLICIACEDKRNIDSQKIALVLINMANGIIPQKTIWV